MVNKRFMKALNTIVLIVLAVLSLLAGSAKVWRMPQEVEFLQGVGLSTGVIIAFGALQVAGGILLLWPRTRRVGAVLVMTAFLLSAILVFLSGSLTFGLVSLVPVALAAFALQQAANITHDKSLMRTR
jgi:hypothetical protein